MNRYYDDPYEDAKPCGPGNHPKTGGFSNTGTHMNGRCVKCGINVADERARIRKMVKEGKI